MLPASGSAGPVCWLAFLLLHHVPSANNYIISSHYDTNLIYKVLFKVLITHMTPPPLPPEFPSQKSFISDKMNVFPKIATKINYFFRWLQVAIFDLINCIGKIIIRRLLFYFFLQ